MEDSRSPVEAGQAVYTPSVLRVYDLIVLGLSNGLIWRCPTAALLKHYDRNVSPNHLDVGVGSGFYLDRCRFPAADPRLALMDLNPNALRFAARRIARFDPETYPHDVLEPVHERIPPFDSIGMTYLLHCLPGRIKDKAKAFDHVGVLGHAGAVVFGATILPDLPMTRRARALMAFYNRRGIFSNRDDDLPGLTAALNARFETVTVHTVGCVALFSARLPDAPGSAAEAGPAGRS